MWNCEHWLTLRSARLRLARGSVQLGTTLFGAWICSFWLSSELCSELCLVRLSSGSPLGARVRLVKKLWSSHSSHLSKSSPLVQVTCSSLQSSHLSKSTYPHGHFFSRNVVFTRFQACSRLRNWFKLPPFSSQFVAALAGCQQRPERWRGR